MASRNSRMVDALAGANRVGDAVARAMRRVDRALFLPPALAADAYVDSPLPIGFGATISAPSIVAAMTTELDVCEGMRVLEVGTGSGYQSAIIAEIIGAKGKLSSIERVPELAETARGLLARLGYKNVEVTVSDGSKGLPEKAPFDRIIVTAASPRIPEPLVEQLKQGGRMVLPVGPAYAQELVAVEKTERGFTSRILMPVIFVPLIGKHGFRE